MIQSMTAFARRETKGSWGSAVWEIRSVNHRYLEASLRLPDGTLSLEPLLRQTLRDHLQRGKIDITLRYQPATTQSSSLEINKDFAQQLINAHAKIANLMVLTPPLEATDILRWPGVLQIPETDFSALEATLLDAFDAALQELVQLRQREGSALLDTLNQRLDAMPIQIAKVQHQLPIIQKEQREKIAARLAEIKQNLDASRLEQEIVLFTQKIDVAEELDRLQIHIHEMKRTLQRGGACGRRLDFLLQELNREANTLSSKSVAAETTLAAVELKVLIEQMREQVQNIE